LTEREPLRPLSAAERMMLEGAVSRYQDGLTGEAVRYLTGRGLTREVVDGFRLGVVSDPMPAHARYAGWLSIPYLRYDGLPVSIRFRCIRPGCDHEGHGKYMSLPGEPSRMFNVGAIHNADDTIHVCEGELDAIVLAQIGLYAVAIPGANGWRPHHRRMLAGFSKVYVWGDPDPAGAEFTATVCGSLRGAARAVQLSVGDVTETYLQGGAEALLELVQEA